MKNAWERIKEWIANHKDLLWIGLIAYVIHFTFEGLLANLIYYKGIKPGYAAFKAAMA